MYRAWLAAILADAIDAQMAAATDAHHCHWHAATTTVVLALPTAAASPLSPLQAGRATTVASETAIATAAACIENFAAATVAAATATTRGCSERRSWAHSNLDCSFAEISGGR